MLGTDRPLRNTTEESEKTSDMVRTPLLRDLVFFILLNIHRCISSLYYFVVMRVLRQEHLPLCCESLPVGEDVANIPSIFLISIEDGIG